MPRAAAGPVALVVTATSIPDDTPLGLRGKPQVGTAATATTTALSGGTASANLTLDPTQPNVISAEATFTVTAVVSFAVAQAPGPEGPFTHGCVAAAFEGLSRLIYRTRGGRELQP